VWGQTEFQVNLKLGLTPQPPFDLGAFTFDHEGVLLISDKINGTVGFHEALLR